jgi:hypothetical protein
LLVLALAACQSPREEPAPAEPEPARAEAEVEAEWIILFDGTDLEHFDQLGEAEWNLVDDYVEADGFTQSYLVTKEAYGDFELEVDFWPSSEANSGIYIRNQNSEAINADSGYEINIYDTNENPDNRTGAIINFSPPIEATIVGEQWNTYEIRAEGSRIVVRLNGELVNELEDDTYASGPIALQNNGGLIRFRNVRVRPL